MSGDQQGADQDDAVDRVGARHQRSVEDGGDLRDHLESDEHRKCEVRDQDDQMLGHGAAASWGASISCRARSLTISPPWVTQAPLVISSSKSTLIVASFVRCSSRLVTLREYSWLAWSATVLGTLVVPSTQTPSTSITRPGRVSSQLPPISDARSTITEPRRMPLTIGAVTRIGALRPGTAAVVITTSAAPTRPVSSSRCLARNSADCSRAYPP